MSETPVRAERSMLDIVNDVFGNLQDIVRSEIRLAKAELSVELRAARSSALSFGMALLAAGFAALFLLLSAMYALSLWMSTWGAALCVALAMAGISLAAFLIAKRSSRTPQNVGRRTAASIRENLQ
jgi:uncharacterized membrane protein YqjE